ncbi:MAG TPA: acyltransferase [Caulobacteraceae bacterium]|nr:acyltransferase [Caulobacteraceae bacterium]
MRGVAAIVVMLFHLGVPYRAVSGWFGSGYLAVDFFFALSGFVLAHAYGERTMSAIEFLKARAIRLYPLYFAGIVFGLSAALASGVTLGQVVKPLSFGLFFLPSPTLQHSGHIPLYPLDLPAWSLLFELLANAVWYPLRSRLRGPLATLVIALSALAVIALSLAFGSLDTGAYWNNFVSGFGRVAFSFLMGALIYRVWRHTAFRPKLPSWLVAGGLLVILASRFPHVVFDPVAVILLMPPLVFLGACCETVSNSATQIQTSLGEISYAVYTLHLPIIILGNHLLVADGALRGLVAHPALVAMPLTVSAILLTAWSLDAFYDRPVRRWLSRIGGSHRDPPERHPLPAAASTVVDPPTLRH